MKNIILTIGIIIFNNITLNSQCSNITHLDHNLTDVNPGVQGYYYKDINNVLNNFEGTYLYSSTNMSLKIKLQKKIMSSMNNVYCEDMIIGGSEYIKNGILQFNSIPLLNSYFSDGYKYKLTSSTIMTGDYRCEECGANEKWLIGSITDPTTEQWSEIKIRKIVYNGQEALKIRIHVDIMSRIYKEGTTPPPSIKLPAGEDLILIKQP